MLKQDDFLNKLQQEAKLQSKIYQHRVIPQSLDCLATFVLNFFWQVLVALSLVTAILIEFFNRQ